MKWIIPALCLVLTVALIGCGRGNPGGPGAAPKDKDGKTTTTTTTTTTDATGDKTKTTDTKTTDTKTTTTDTKTAKTDTTTTDSSRTFTIDVPNLATDMKQGETKQVNISLDRGRNFTETVTLSFDNVPKGITIDPNKADLKQGDKEAKFSVKAADDAPVGTFKVTVIGKPMTGVNATNELKISVEKK